LPFIAVYEQQIKAYCSKLQGAKIKKKIGKDASSHELLVFLQIQLSILWHEYDAGYANLFCRNQYAKLAKT
jgi:hypothetical protein